MRQERTRVAVVGAGPAGLVLAMLLAREGIDAVVVDHRTREEIEGTVRAGILEQGTVELLDACGAGARIGVDGARHDGIGLRVDGTTHRVDLRGHTGRSVWLYPQHEVLTDLLAWHRDHHTDLRLGVSGATVAETGADGAVVTFTGADGVPVELACEALAGCDGSRSVVRGAIPDRMRTDHFRALPFAWFGVLLDAPPSAKELVYASSERGFALISSRTPTVQRMYFQCDPAESTSDWSDARILDELQARVAGADGFALVEGPVLTRDVIPMRSYVCEPMRHRRVFLAGDAAHTVPPTGAKGLNLAVADVVLLAGALTDLLVHRRDEAVDRYAADAARRVWRTQQFSYHLTTTLHPEPGADPFDERRRRAAVEHLVTSQRAAAELAEGYVGWPLPGAGCSGTTR
ncbi:4-hydroxybenzoate 3-monooxygenase [Pseudonocardia sp. DR1-2]|uniref:4-hydroxybenzoate 3-monooxygenase n=1 Tax=Pseudonocardia sp. DR1-2 TaxID=2951168 RepID=UPI0020447EE2|nr:4-hydroxybenzoate 3-monooxygenase [Pseudonocardia sp. DR1-2]MCM3847131.1 4-hydroxybenzoate 3-monooxygenase [Pseudonocardia sp. DR1-2]